MAPEEVAAATLEVLRRTVPATVPTINFLSGGQSPEEATANLNAMNAMDRRAPWVLSFSFARALQDPVMHAWKGEPRNVAPAQEIFTHRLRMNSLARDGQWTAANERESGLRGVQLAQDVLALHGGAVEVVEARHRFVQALGAEDDLERLDRSLLVEHADALGQSTLCDPRSRSRDLQVVTKLGSLREQRLGAAVQRGDMRVRGRDLLVERVHAEHRRTRFRGDRGVARTQRQDAVRRVRAADRRNDHDGKGDRGERQQPTPRRVCLPKHGARPYHSLRAGQPFLVQKYTSFGSRFFHFLWLSSSEHIANLHHS